MVRTLVSFGSRTLGASMTGALVVLTLGGLAIPSPASAQDDSEVASGEASSMSSRPTSGEASLYSGRTLGVGETMVGGGAGWPGIFAIVQHGLSSTFNIGVRAGLNYGSPVMGVEPGVGGEVGIPIRIHLLGEGSVDLAAYVEPAFSLAEGAAMGQANTIYRGEFGWSSRLEFGGILGLNLQERLTLLFGLGGHLGFVHVPGAGDPDIVAAVLGRLGLEGLISRDTMLFVVAEGGAGFADDSGAGAPVFDPGLTSVMLRVLLGLAYLL